MKIAIVHDWLITIGGAEKVLEQMILCFPEADLFSIVDFLSEDKRDFLKDKKVNTTFIQKMPFSRKYFRNFLCLMPHAIEQLDLSRYDLIISSSHSFAKGVITGPDQLHISYIHTPIRYAWDLQNLYLNISNLDKGIKSLLVRYLLHKIRIWDVRTANGVDEFLANSEYIVRRIWKVYKRNSKVIYPPVDVKNFEFYEKKEDFYVTVSRFVPYKRIDLIVQAFSLMKDKKLVVIGDGTEMKKIQKIATDNIVLMGRQPFGVVNDYLKRAKAFVFAAEEDFGIAPVEAQACGTPVIAYGKGGCLETIRGLDQDKPTGLFFKEQTVEDVINAVNLFESRQRDINPSDCRDNAMKFSEERFREQFISNVRENYEKRI